MTNTNLRWNEAATAVLTAADTASGIWVTPGADEATVLILTASGAMTVTISAGDGLQGTEDLQIVFQNAGTRYLSVESGRYLQTRGENAGKLLIKPSTSGLTVGCLRLPR